jgi:hypothetical protein
VGRWSCGVGIPFALFTSFIEVDHTNVSGGRYLYYVYLIQYSPIYLFYHSTLGNHAGVFVGLRWYSVHSRKRSVPNLISFCGFRIALKHPTGL